MEIILISVKSSGYRTWCFQTLEIRLPTGSIILQKQTNKKTHRKRDEICGYPICGYQRWEMEGGGIE